MQPTTTEPAAPERSPYLLRSMPCTVLLCAALLGNFVLADGHDRQRILEICILLLCASFVLLRRTGDMLLAQNKPLACFFLLGVLSTLQAYAFKLAFFEVAIFFLLFLCALAVADEVTRHGRQGLLLVLNGIAIGCTLYAFRLFVLYVGSISLHTPLDLDDFSIGFSNVRFFNHAQTSTLPLLILLCCLTPRTARIRWLWLAVTTYWWTALFATMGRGTLAGIAAGCAVAAVLQRRRAIPYLGQVGLTAASGLALYFVFLVVVPAVTGQQGMSAFSDAVERTAAAPATGRTFLWRRAIALIVQHPLLGVGPMHYAHYTGGMLIAAHPHDWLMQIGSEWGLPALASLLMAVIWAVTRLRRAGDRVGQDDAPNRTIHTALLVGAVAILVDGLVSGLFVMPQSQLGIVLYLGCAIGWYKSVAPAAPSRVPGMLRRAGGAILLLTAMAGVANVWPDIIARYEDRPLAPGLEALNKGKQWPRLWRAGFF